MNNTLYIVLLIVACLALSLAFGYLCSELNARWRKNRREPMPIIKIVCISGGCTPPMFLFIRARENPPKPPKQVPNNIIPFPKPEPRSNCCGARPRGETHMGHGFCNRCGEGAVFDLDNN